MNQGLYKLVFSKVLNIYVPVSEAVRGRAAKSGKRVRKFGNNAFTLILIFSSLQAAQAFADVVTDIQLTKQIGATVNITPIRTDVNQTQSKAILDWRKLNIGKNYLLNFNQQGNRNWSALNRISDLSPSILNGIIKADGNVYFINKNGIIFGNNAQFNVGSLYAGTLDISNDIFNEGLLANPFRPAFEGVGGFVTVESGAQLTTANGGKVLLFAPTVTNNGVITTSEGQTILAAGKKVYLQASSDPAGFLVEVDSGGTATNLGKIVADRGNITMMGLAVNQAGTLSATTSVRANGSIHLLAQDSLVSSNSVVPIGNRDGIVTLVKGSVTEVKPEVDNKEETIASQTFNTSKIKIEASLINIDGTVSAKGGNITASTVLSDASALLNSQNPRRIYLGKNAIVDVSGVDAVAPMSRNQIEAQLFSAQLNDAPILRDSGLAKGTVFVDARKGTELFDIKPFVAGKGATTAEKMTKGGTVTFSTPNDIIAEAGSVINVSGGSTTYAAGQIKETNLSYNGKLIPISEAKDGLPYDKIADVYSVTSKKWGVTRTWDLSSGGTKGWGKATLTNASKAQVKIQTINNQVASYVEGDDAGTLNLTQFGDTQFTQNVSLGGKLLANTKIGTEQVINNTIPKGGQFIASANDLTIAKTALALTNNFKFEDKLDTDFISSIGTDFLAQGFNNIDLSKVKNVTINSEMVLKPNGNLILSGKAGVSSTEINDNIVAPASNITLAALKNTIADNVKIITAGIFTNNSAGIAGQNNIPAAINGGNFNSKLLTVGKNVTIDASAGAAVNSDGKVIEGNAGNINFITNDKIDSTTNFKSFGFNEGGELSIEFGEVGTANGQKTILNIGGNPTTSIADFNLAGDFFSKGGFSQYALSAFDINIGDNSASPQTIVASAQTWQLNSDFTSKAGGQYLSAVAKPVLQADYLRAPVDVNLSALSLGGTLNLAENTSIVADRGATVSLSAGKQVNILGDISTPSGNINIAIIDTDVVDTTRPIFDASQAAFIGEKANLSAAGSSIKLPDSQANLLKTQVFNAGKISIDAPKGAVVVKNGSVLDVSGTSIVNDTKTIAGYKRETLHGDAGTIVIGASDGLLIDGTLTGNSTGTGRAGTLDIGFTNTAISNGNAILQGNREFTITQQKQLQAEGFTKGGTLKTANGDVVTEASTDTIKGQISVEQIAQGGFANLKVKSFLANDSDIAKNSVQLADKVDLKLAGNLKLETPLINIKDNGKAKLSASLITLKSMSPSSTVTGELIVGGEGKLITQSKQLYLDGLSAISGVKETVINTTQDIAGQGNLLQDTFGGIKTTGDINLSARQIYPNTDGKLTFDAVGENSTITVNSNGAVAKPVLSAQGILELKAANVVQKGVLSAPFGQININASKTATFAAGSSTSVSANNQIIPYSTTSTGGTRFDNKVGSNPKKTDLVDKGVTIKSVNVDLQKNAVVDLSAGGDMFAYEFVPGIGGSKDLLAQPNTYAIMPSLGQDYAAFDPTYAGSSANVAVSKQIYITGVQGLASGNYTLLPARYALVPGAKMVQFDPANNTFLPSQTSPAIDGSNFTSGYFTDIGTGARDANWSTFKITDGSIFRPAAVVISKASSQYLLTSATSFFSNPRNTGGIDVNVPIDLARLSLDAKKLNIESTIVANKKAGGNGLNVDFSADAIRVVNAQDTADTASLQLTASALNNLQADSILLGGSRKLENGVTKITTNAQTISFENNSQNVIKKPEIIATANDTITIKNGAFITTGVAASNTGNLNLETSGNGSFLAISSINDIDYTRIGGSGNAATGQLNIEAGSSINAGRSVVLDATKLAKLNGSVVLQDGGSATLGANRILLGNAPTNVSGLIVNTAALAALGQLKSLALNSYNNIDTFGSVNFGNNKLDLTLNGAGIVGNLAAGELAATANAVAVQITANNFTLKNSLGTTFAAPSDNSGRELQINANNAKFEGKDASNTVANAGNTNIAGFTKLTVKANEIRVAKQGEVSIDVAQTTLQTGRLTADSGADYSIKTNENLNISALNNAVIGTDKSVGAKLAITAKDLSISTNIDVASGNLLLTAQNDLNLNNGANLNASASPSSFYNIIEYAPAGSVSLKSAAGNVNINTGAIVDVTSAGMANAGAVKIEATAGTVNLAGDLNGAASGTGKSGQLEVDVKTLASLSTTDKQATGFTEARQYRVRTGDVAITGTGANALKARETNVSADAGKITVTGEIIANAPKNSKIVLYAGNGVTLESTAKLEAKSTQAVEEGGKVNFAATNDVLDNTPDLINFKTGSVIDVSGGVGGKGGKVNVTAPRTFDNTDIEIAQIGTTFVGVDGAVNLNGLKAYDTSSIEVANQATALNESQSFMQSALNGIGKGLQRLGLVNNPQFIVSPGVEFRNKTGNLTLPSDWNLFDAKFDPTTGVRITDATQLSTGLNANGNKLIAGTLNLRASGNVIINGTLSDGFSTANLNQINQVATPAIPKIPEKPAVIDENGDEISPLIPAVPAIPAKGPTGVEGLAAWSYNIAAGTDFTAANPLATVTAEKNPATGNAISGNLEVASSKGIRTGNGDINIAAGGDLVMKNANSVIYTVGNQAAVLAGFDAPTGNANPLYLNNGGDISITTNGNIIGGESQSNNRPLINQWLFRQGGGSANKDTTWWVRPDLFKQSVATLGGGDVVVKSGGNISNFSVSAATTARFDTNGSTKNKVVNGGGDVLVKAEGDITNGVYFVSKGDGEIKAGGNIQKGENTFGTVLALQDGQFNINTGKNSSIEAVINPTLVNQSTLNATLIDRSGNNAYFNSYSENAKVAVTSLNGNVEFGGGNNIASNVAGLDNAAAESLKYAPSQVSLVTHNGNIDVKEIVLLPSAKGDLKVLAASNVKIGNIVMSDADVRLLPSVDKPVSRAAINENVLGKQVLNHSPQLLHKNNTEPNVIVAQKGDISNTTSTEIIVLAKATKLVAGQDIKNINLILQNNNAADISLIKAGQDITSGNVTVAGPGELLVSAGRDINLSNNSSDIFTTGNAGNSAAFFNSKAISNPALPTEGASITLQAGLGKGANIQTYIDRYISPTGIGPATIVGSTTKLNEYRANTSNSVTDYMRTKTGNPNLSSENAFIQFNALDNDAKLIYLNRHLTTELIKSAEGFAKAGNHNRGSDAIAALFPTQNAGDILLFASKVATNSGGSIDMIAPSGQINVGAPGKAFKQTFTNPDTGEVTNSGEIGVITEKGGAIRAIADGDFSVNQSKVITQFGSDIAIWSSKGTIDAGRGSKTATSIPERIVQTDVDGNTTIEVRGVASGSGIRAQTYDPDGPNGPKKERKKGNVFLTAPVVDAGEAGIEAGDLLIVAPIVLNAANIQVQGASSGVPIAATGSIAGAGVSTTPDAVNAATASVAQSVAQTANQTSLKPELPSILYIKLID